MSNTQITHGIHRGIQGWFDFDDLYKQIVADPKNKKLVEVGSWKGKSAMFMAVEIALSGRDIEFYCVDTWEGCDDQKGIEDVEVMKSGQLYDIFIKNIEPVKEYIVPIRKASLEAVNDFEDNSLDFVFIDASHAYLDVKEDLKAWWPKVKKGGVFAGHDYKHWAGVKKAVDEFAVNNNLKASGVSKGSWLISE